MPFPGSKPGGEQIFPTEWGKARYANDLSPADVLKGFIKTEKRLRYLVGKHFALRRLRELCRLFQQKWTLAGALAPLDRTSMLEFAWGAAEAGHVLGKTLSARQQWNDARAALQQALATRRQIGDPRAEATQDLLGSIPG
jgi:hypothetical protein